jgi:hypothetical protein
MGYIGAGISRFNTADELTVTGDVTASGTVLPTGDTAAGDAAAVGFTSAEGLILTGQGSSSDLTIKNDADATVFSVPTGQQKILFPDNARALFGDGSDLQIYHDGSDSYINDTGTGNLRLAGSSQIDIISSGGEFMAKFIADGAATLYHDNSAKIATTSSGVDVTGTAVVDALTCSGSATIEGTSTFGTSSADTRFNFDGPNQYRAVFKHSGNIAGQIGGGGADELRFSNAAGAIVASITGGGITFNGDTAAANALDDYEEGTYTPAFTSTGATFSYSVQLGSYVKIGQLVCCWFNITLNASPSGTTNQQVTFNVPFATNNVDNSLYSGGHIGHYFNINLGSGTSIAYQLPSASSTQIELKEIGDNIGENGIVASELNSSAVIRGSVMYRAAS